MDLLNAPMPEAYLRVHPNPHKPQYRSPRRVNPSGVCVVHTAENDPDQVGTDTGAEAVARYETIRTTPGSYHDLCDSDSIINLVRYSDEAWHDATGTNPHSYGVSGATEASSWHSPPTSREVELVKNMAKAAARYALWVRGEYGVVIPARRITAAQARAKVPGFISHAELDPGRRTDPGARFPWTTFLSTFAAFVKENTHNTPQEDIDMDAADLSAMLDAKLKPIKADIAEIERQLTVSDEGKGSTQRTVRHIVASDLNNGD